jgi:hypothetical protein
MDIHSFENSENYFVKTDDILDYLNKRIDHLRKEAKELSNQGYMRLSNRADELALLRDEIGHAENLKEHDELQANFEETLKKLNETQPEHVRQEWRDKWEQEEQSKNNA